MEDKPSLERARQVARFAFSKRFHRTAFMGRAVKRIAERGRLIGFSNMPGQREYHDDEQDQAESAAGIISPAGAIRPGRQRADEEQNQDDEKDE